MVLHIFTEKKNNNFKSNIAIFFRNFFTKMVSLSLLFENVDKKYTTNNNKL